MHINTISDLSSQINPRFQTLLCVDESGNRIIVKKYVGSMWDNGYRELVSESKISRVLSGRKCRNIYFPKLINVETAKNECKLTYEYVPGKKLSRFCAAYKAEIIEEIIDSLAELSESLSKEEKKVLPKQGTLFLILSIVIFFFRFIVRDPKHATLIFHATVGCLANLDKLHVSHLVLAHRDLKPDNVIVAKDKICVLDWEQAVLTHELFDFNKVIASEVNSAFSNLLVERKPEKVNPILARYICLNYGSSISTGNSHAAGYLSRLVELVKK